MRDANAILASGLTPEILQYKAIEAWLQLSQSPNSKVIISNGNVPMLLNAEGVPALPGTMGATSSPQIRPNNTVGSVESRGEK